MEIYKQILKGWSFLLGKRFSAPHKGYKIVYSPAIPIH